MGIAENETTQKLKDNKMMEGWRLFRHNSGKFYQGNKVTAVMKGSNKPMQMLLITGYIQGGEKGESDQLGFIPLKITAEMVGKTIAQFTAVEVKTKSYKYLTKEQRIFLKAVVKSGGRGFICRESDCEMGFELEEIL